MNDVSAFSHSRGRMVMIVCLRKSRSARSLGGPRAVACDASGAWWCWTACRSCANPAKVR
jgi:hypothetical protein